MTHGKIRGCQVARIEGCHVAGDQIPTISCSHEDTWHQNEIHGSH